MVDLLAKGAVMLFENYDFDMALHAYADHLSRNYLEWNKSLEYKIGDRYSIEFVKGRKFLKVVKNWGSRSVHSFICVKPHDRWYYGDILKAASWAQPAKNFVRGNVLDTDSYKTHSWMGL